MPQIKILHERTTRKCEGNNKTALDKTGINLYNIKILFTNKCILLLNTQTVKMYS
jgi:hypothetical protein